MPQFEGLSIPFSGDSDAKTSGNAYWLQTIRRAALGRNTQTLPQDPAKTGIILAWGVQDLPQGSVIGAIGATYPGSPAAEPSPYMQAHLDRSQLTLYTLQSFAAANTYIECFAFAENEPVRIRVDYDAGDFYRTGMPVGRLSGSTKVRSGGGGLLLASLPYTPDAGANYYSWVILDKTNRWQVRYKDNIAAADNAETTPSTGQAYIDLLKADEDLETITDLEITVTNRNETASFTAGSFGEVTWDKGEWVPIVSASGGGNEVIKFRILSASPAIGRGFNGCDFVLAEVTQVGCGLSGVQIGDIVNIWDSEYCKFNLPIDLLTGLRGTAQRFKNSIDIYDLENLVDCEYDVLAEGPCLWVVNDVCCAEEYTL